jgi:hypothetical protein
MGRIIAGRGRDPIQVGRDYADAYTAMTSRSLALLAAFASPLVGAAAIAGWLAGVWPATPLTFMTAAVAVVGGPLLGIVHVVTADEDDEPPARVPPAPAGRPRRIPLDAVTATPRLAAARRFHNWRDRSNEAIAVREHEELLRRNEQLARRLRRTRT